MVYIIVESVLAMGLWGRAGGVRDGGISTVTTNMRNTQLAERVLRVVKATWEAGITGEELTNAVTGVRATTIREA